MSGAQVDICPRLLPDDSVCGGRILETGPHHTLGQAYMLHRCEKCHEGENVWIVSND